MAARNPSNLWSIARMFADKDEDSEKSQGNENSPDVAHQEGAQAPAGRRCDVDGAGAREAPMSKRVALDRWVRECSTIVIGMIQKKWHGKVDGREVIGEVVCRMLESSKDLPSDAQHRRRYLLRVAHNAACALHRGDGPRHEPLPDDLESENSRQWEKMMEDFQEAERFRKALEAKEAESSEWADAIRVWKSHRLDKRTIVEIMAETRHSNSTVDRRICKVEEWLEKTFRKGGGRS